jgi:uncharacterized delta-60 repeat protein
MAFALVACGGDDDEEGTTGGQTTAPGRVAIDTAFGTNGVAAVPLSGSAHDRFMATAIAPDGKIYGAGFVLQGDDQAMAVARLDASGKLDPTFGTNGIAVANAAAGGKAAELARGIIIQSGGKIVISGAAEHDVSATGDAARDTDIAVARFDSTGKLDPTFGRNGIAMIDVSTGKVTTGTTFVGDTSWGMAAAANDKIVIFGSALAAGADRTDSDWVIVGLTSAGALDTAFGTGGKVAVDIDQTSGNPRNVLVQADGKIVATGYANLNGVVQPVLIRTTAAGVMDSTFGKGGVATAQVLAGVAESYAVQQQGDNYILGGYGRGADTAEKVDMIVYRFTANGTFDTSFGTNGVTRIDIAKEDDRTRNVLVLPDGQIMAVGSGKRNATNVDAMIGLFSKDGAPVTTFGENGQVISDLGGPADAWYGVALAPDKKSVIVAGYKGTDANSGGNDDAYVAKILL